MKITFDSAALSRQLSAASRVLNNKNSMPILDCFLLRVADGGEVLSITASDTENTLALTCPLVSYEETVPGEGNGFCVKARLIMDALKEIPSQPVTLTIDPQTMLIGGRYANGTFSITGELADEYPLPPGMGDGGNILTLPASQLLEEIEGTQFALADDEIRPVMTGIFFDITPEKMICVGTDGRILVRRSTDACEGIVLPEEPASFILPKKTSVILRALLAKEDGEVRAVFNDKLLFVTAGGFDLHARLIDGRYPAYQTVIPTDNPYSASLQTCDLLPAVRRVLTFADKESALVRITMKTDVLLLSGSDVNYATSSEESVPCTWNGPDRFAVGIKGGLLIEVLQHLPKEVDVKMSEPKRPVLFMPAEQDEHTSVLMLIMPMMLPD